MLPQLKARHKTKKCQHKSQRKLAIMWYLARNIGYYSTPSVWFLMRHDEVNLEKEKFMVSATFYLSGKKSKWWRSCGT